MELGPLKDRGVAAAIFFIQIGFVNFLRSYAIIETLII